MPEAAVRESSDAAYLKGEVDEHCDSKAEEGDSKAEDVVCKAEEGDSMAMQQCEIVPKAAVRETLDGFEDTEAVLHMPEAAARESSDVAYVMGEENTPEAA
eukprot:13450456-Alexandrium_andersonii.AAC.1